ncbi:methyltransferase family protein [Runella limosa]|uniref:methyltransferase family protein n=1 Tax=Runella limosa TaxID=370978 RepID=UPI00048DD4BF|nr:isoprenylcysteine carboxylmethyltransferase family protein [Runella limosa]
MKLYLLQISLWIVYGFIHSALASPKVKHIFEQKLGRLFRYYRLLYNVLAVGLLIGLLWYQRLLPKERLWAAEWWVGGLAITLFWIGVLIALKALLGYDLGEFLGVPNPPTSPTSSEFRTGGLLRYVRHPLYTGTILAVWGLFFNEATLQTLIMAVCITVYIRIGIVYEERKLVREFGDTYVEYRRRVAMLFPKLF